MTTPDVYVLGGYQTDFARNWTKENKHFSALMREACTGALRGHRRSRPKKSRAPTSATSPPSSTACRATSARSSPRSIRPSAVCRRVATRRPAPRARIALLAASAEIEAGRYDLQAVVGIEQMKTVVGRRGRRLPRHRRLVRAGGRGHRVPVPEALRQARRRVRQALRPEGRAPRRDQPAQLRQRQAQPQRPDPHLVHEQGARALPHDDNPTVGGRIRIADCSQVTDGAVCVFLASRDYAEKWAAGHGQARSTTSRASRAGATTRRGSASTTRSPRARTPSTCCRTCAARSPRR